MRSAPALFRDSIQKTSHIVMSGVPRFQTSTLYPQPSETPYGRPHASSTGARKRNTTNSLPPVSSRHTPSRWAERRPHGTISMLERHGPKSSSLAAGRWYQQAGTWGIGSDPAERHDGLRRRTTKATTCCMCSAPAPALKAMSRTRDMLLWRSRITGATLRLPQKHYGKRDMGHTRTSAERSLTREIPTQLTARQVNRRRKQNQRMRPHDTPICLATWLPMAR